MTKIGENMGHLTALVPYARISEDMTKGKSEGWWSGSAR